MSCARDFLLFGKAKISSPYDYEPLYKTTTLALPPSACDAETLTGSLLL